MKIYTKTGDEGFTGLIGGQRVSKADVRVECYGTVDELNAVIGWVAVESSGELTLQLKRVQNELFVVGSHLAVAEESMRVALPEMREESIAALEREMDAATAELPPLRHFILPGGCETASRLHVARTVCRRAERAVVDLSGQTAVPDSIIRYLNRLGDWLFVQARSANQRAGVADVEWEK